MANHTPWKLLTTQQSGPSGTDRADPWNGECQREYPFSLTGRGMRRIATLQKRRCPFTEDPFADCYVARLRSQDIVNAISYCGGEYEECEIYRKRMRGAKDEYLDKDEDLLSCQCQRSGQP